MSAKRRQSIKREGYQSFVPNYPPSFHYGKTLTNTYDKECFLEGYNKAKRLHELLLQDELEAERAIHEHIYL
jgi:hypothetical protein